nr:E-beta-farnesene synthase [Tanacetum cinerariifolium]
MRKHKFHPRPDSPLHLPDEEPVLGYLKFNAKGTKREVFGMPIPGSFITADIQGASYYQEYLAKVAKHQRYLAGKTGSDPDCPAPKPTKTAKKSKPTAPKADLRPPVSKPASSKQPEPKPAPTKTQGKKRKLKEPRVDDEEADVHRALEESLKSMYDVPRGPLSPVVIREPESRKYQPLLEVPGKGKETVTEEQVSRDLLTLQTPKKKSPADRYIFQRRTSAPTGSSGHDESSSLYAELGLTDSEEESDKDVPGTDAGIQAEGQAGPDLGDAEASQPLPSPIVYAGSDLEHMDLDIVDVSTQPLPEKMDEGFTATAYPKVQENLKLTVEEHVILEEPASSSGTLSSLQHLTKHLSFGDLFFSDKSLEADNDKATTKTEAESMVSVTIQQDTSLIPPMTTLIIDLTSRPESPKVHQLLKETATETTTTTTTHPPPSQQHQRTTYSMMMKRIDHMQLYEALEKSINRDHSKELAKDMAESRKKKKKRRDSPKTPPGSPPHQPPPLPPPTGPSGASGSLGASRSSQVLPPPPPPLSTNQEDLQMDDDMAPDAQAQSSDDEDIGNAHIPKVNLRQDWWKPLEEERLATPEPAWSIPSSDVPVPKNNWASVLASTYSPPLEDSLLAQTGDIDMHNVSKPLPLGGPPGQVTIQSDFFFNKDLEYLRYDIKGSRPALSISKMKAAYYPDVGLEQMVTDQMSLEPPITQRQEDSYYCRQLIDQTFGYPTTSRILPGKIWGSDDYALQ